MSRRDETDWDEMSPHDLERLARDGQLVEDEVKPQRHPGTMFVEDEATLHWRDALDEERAIHAQIRHDEAGS